MKKLIYICLLLFIYSNTYSQNTEIQYLSGTDRDHTLTWDFFCTQGMNSGKWTTIQVPSNWEQQGFGVYNYGTEKEHSKEQGLYKYQFTVSKTWKSKKVYLVFEGSMTDTEVKINGKSAGATHQGAFYRFRYDVSNLVKYGDQNLLEVTVSKESADATITKAERKADYWIFGGIFRPVYLEAVPTENIDRVAIDAKADGSFSMNVFLSGISKAKTIEAQVQTTDGKPFSSAIKVSIDAKKDLLNLKGSFTAPKLWSPETPNLYDVVLTLKDGKKTVHQIKQRFGFRTVEVKENNGIYVNGTKIMFRGVCRHTFDAKTARCSSKELSISDVNMIKDMNMNAVRMSHYPPDQHFLDVCDSLGLFVLDELGGWQAFYSTEQGKRLVKQMVDRDVNHPSIVLWDNGNEGGFNPDLRTEFGKYDIQNRTVIEPWAKINGTNTKHYPSFKYLENAFNEKLIYFPTEFLHGLYDGGHGAGLDEYWNFMTSQPLSAGGFLWVFADEGIIRKDLNDSIDTHGNQAPDGIVGAFHEKEGSYYTIKEIWSTVHIDKTKTFKGTIAVKNRFLYTNLNQCKFSAELVKFAGTFPKFETQKQVLAVVSPNIAAGDSGVLKLDLPANWKQSDVIYLTAIDNFGRQIYTWSWAISSPKTIAEKTVKEVEEVVKGAENDGFVTLNSGKVSIQFSKKTGLITEVKNNTKLIPFTDGTFVGDTLTFKSLKHYQQGRNYVVEMTYDKSPECYAKWTMLAGGWIKLEYQYHPKTANDFSGITFNYPEKLVTGATLMANGSYRVWKNRLKGVEFGVFNKKYNNTVTGETWDYPEFKGYYSNFYAVEIQTKELPFTILTETPDLFLHLFTPQSPKFVAGGTKPPFPSGNISILNGISAIGTKFAKSETLGLQSQKNKAQNQPFSGIVYFNFGE